MKKINEILETENAYKSCFKFQPVGITTIDKLIGGYCKGELVAIVGDGCSGRSSLVRAMIKNLSVDNKIQTAYFVNSYWGPKAVRFLMAGMAHINCKDWNANCHSEQIDHAIESAKALVVDTPLYIHQEPHTSIEQLTKMICELAHQGVYYFFIDSLQGITISTTDTHWYQCDHHKSLILKKLAIELGVTIVVTCMMNWIYAEQEGFSVCKPSLHGLVQVGDLNEFADIVISLSVPENDEIYMDAQGRDLRGITEVSALKNSHGPLGSGRMKRGERLLTYEDVVL